jgi:hypothetical protein
VGVRLCACGKSLAIDSMKQSIPALHGIRTVNTLHVRPYGCMRIAAHPGMLSNCLLYPHTSLIYHRLLARCARDLALNNADCEIAECGSADLVAFKRTLTSPYNVRHLFRVCDEALCKMWNLLG